MFNYEGKFKLKVGEWLLIAVIVFLVIGLPIIGIVSLSAPWERW